MQKFWKSVKIWQSYREFKGGTFFLRHSVYMWILQTESDLIRIKAGDDDCTRYAGVSQIYDDTDDSCNCDMLSWIANAIVSMSYDRRMCDNCRTPVCE